MTLPAISVHSAETQPNFLKLKIFLKIFFFRIKLGGAG